MKILRFTDKGITKFQEYYYSLSTASPQTFPEDLLAPSVYAEEIGGSTDWLDELNLDNAFDSARDLDEIVKRLSLKSAERDLYFWSWCSAYLFRRLCNTKKDGSFKPGEIAIWIHSPNIPRRYYRHYLASIWQLYNAHDGNEEKLIALLGRPVNTPGELWSQIAGSKKRMTNDSMLKMIYHLYWDKSNKCRKTGAGSNPRRLNAVLGQFEKTFDFFSMTSDQLIDILPSEFDKYIERQVEIPSTVTINSR